MDKTVSIIIPSYKYAHYLTETVESVLKQTHPVDEIIIVDDGSPDNTGEVAQEIIKKYPDKNISYILKENGGLSSARNAGIRVATGEYIMCLDSDDKLVPGAIEEHLKLMENDMTIAQCGLMEFGERYIMYAPTHETGLERVLKANTIFCNAMFSKRMWSEVGGYDESETIRLGYEDWEFWIRLLKAGCQVKTSEFIALRYRVHGNNMTKETAHPNRQKLYQYLYDKHRDLYEKFNIKISGMIYDNN